MAAAIVKVSDRDNGDFNAEFEETAEKRNGSKDERVFL
jgi:hypothetical protein